MPDLELVNVSRLQFAVDRDVPLPVRAADARDCRGSSSSCESVYVMTGRAIYRDMTRFWGLLFGINFVMGVTTGLTLEFQFGTNWAYLLALRRRRLRRAARHRRSDGVHPRIDVRRSVLLRLGAARQGPAPAGDVPRGARLEPVRAVDPGRQRLDAEPCRRRVQLRDHADGGVQHVAQMLFNPVAQAKFVHTVAAGYVTACMFVLGVSSWYLLKARDVAFRAALVRRRRRIRPCFDAVGDRAG